MRDKPYLFIEDLDLLKKKVESNSHLYTRLVEQCKRYESVILTEKHPKGSSSFMGMAAANLSLLALLSGEKRWITESKRWIFTALSYKQWGHTHLLYPDISSSWLLFGLALSYSWISDFMTKDEKNIYSNRLLIQGNKKWDYQQRHKKDGWPIRYWQHHNWLNYTGLATVAYALQEDYPEKSKIWLESSKQNFKKILSFLPDDGSDYEGVTYWRYGIIWLIQYAHLIKTHEGIDLYKKSNFLKNTFFYRLYQCSPIFEQNYNFGDCHDTRSGHSSAVYFKLASEYKIPEAQWMGDNVIKNLLYKEAYESSIKPGILPEAFLELIWYNPCIPKRIPKNLAKSKLFPDLGLLSCRSSWSPDAFSFSVKAGYPGGKKQWKKSWELEKEEGFTRRSLCHQHADDGSFILWKGANNYVIDDGYNREVKAEDHNIITFDGRGYSDEGKHNIFTATQEHQFSTIECCVKKDNITYTVMNLKAVYDETLGIKVLKRHFLYSGFDDLIIFDEVEVENSKTISWQIHSEDHLISDNRRYSTLDGNFVLTPLLNKNLIAKRESKIISAVLNLQDPETKTRRKMEKLSFDVENLNKKQYFLNHIQTGVINRGINIDCTEDELGFNITTTNGNIVNQIFINKTGENYLHFTQKKDDKTVIKFYSDDKDDSEIKYIV